MTVDLSIIQIQYDLSIEVDGVTLQTTLISASHRHTASEISDATAVGRALMTAVDAAAARTAIGAGTGGGAGLTDGDHGGVIVSGGGTGLALDYVEIAATLSLPWARLTSLPNTLAGYGIGDAVTTSALTAGLAGKSDTGHTHSWASLTSKPTTLATAGITDAATQDYVDNTVLNGSNIEALMLAVSVRKAFFS